jgi:hypothetical protein
VSTEGLAAPRGNGPDLLVTIDIPEDAPHEIREGLARRRLCFTQGRCPCGAVFTRPNRAQRRAALAAGTVLHVTIEHEDGCPAIDPRIDRMVRP